jgi:hypothetical protein
LSSLTLADTPISPAGQSPKPTSRKANCREAARLIGFRESLARVQKMRGLLLRDYPPRMKAVYTFKDAD